MTFFLWFITQKHSSCNQKCCTFRPEADWAHWQLAWSTHTCAAVTTVDAATSTLSSAQAATGAAGDSGGSSSGWWKLAVRSHSSPIGLTMFNISQRPPEMADTWTTCLCFCGSSNCYVLLLFYWLIKWYTVFLEKKKKTDNHLADHEITCFYETWKFSQLNAVHTFTSHFSAIVFNISSQLNLCLPGDLFSWGFSM